MYKCTTLEEVKQATNNLDRASITPLHINDNGVMKEILNFKGVYNNSTGELCCVASKNYNLVQHKQYIDSFAEAINRLNLNFTMVIKPAYNKIFADISFPDKTHKFEKLNEEFMTGIRLVNSYNKSTGLAIMPRLTRLACANGMILSRNEMSFNIKHTSKMVAEIQTFVEKRVNLIINKYDDLQHWVSKSMKDSIEWDKLCKISEKLFVQVNHREEVLKNLSISVIQKKEKKKAKIISYVNEIKKRKKINRWDFYNAITKYITHGQQITPFLEAYYQKRAERVLMTPMEKLIKITQ